jgi:hypothetical protein
VEKLKTDIYACSSHYQMITPLPCLYQKIIKKIKIENVASGTAFCGKV